MGRRSLEKHDHSGTGNGGNDLTPDTVDANTVTAGKVDSDRVDLNLAVDSSESIVGGDPIDIDVSGRGVFEVELDQDATINLTGADTDGIYSITVIFEDKGFTPTWDSAITWEDGTAPSFSDELRFIQFVTRDGGTTWYGKYTGAF